MTDTTTSEQSVTLAGEDLLRARRAVANLLNHERRKYVAARKSRRLGDARFALERWDAYADLFERMGGDVEGLLDPETAAEHNGQVTR